MPVTSTFFPLTADSAAAASASTHHAATASGKKLHALLDRVQTLEPEYSGGLSSHLPMAMHALHSIGAEPERLQDFYDRYSTRLSPLPDPSPVPASEEPTLGRIDDFPRWRTWCIRRIDDDGVDHVLCEMLPVLAQGSAGAAFHGLIRTGHAVRAGHREELASALAYWAARYHPLPVCSGERVDARRWLAGLADIAKRHAGTWPARNLITEEIADRAAASGFKEAANALDASCLLELARIAAQLYIRTRDFTVLHVVTGSQAARLLKPWMSPEAQQSFVPALAGGLLASGVLESSQLDSWLSRPSGLAAAPPWSSIAPQAVIQQDAHVIKLVAACAELDVALPDAVWRTAAAKAINEGREVGATASS